MIQSNLVDARRWRPRVKSGAEPYYLRLADALQQHIGDGALPLGTRLPTQRTLAETLGVSVGTANAAYTEAERRGLIHRQVGRGTFVASPGVRTAKPAAAANLAVNVPPYHLAAVAIRGLFAQLIEDADTADLLGYPVLQQSDRYRAAASSWIARACRFPAVHMDRVVPCQGATQGILATLHLLLKDRPTLLCERITYAGFKVAARQLGARLVPVEVDQEGLVPDSLDRAAAGSDARVVILTPSLHNPTGAVASSSRRRQIAKVAKARDLWIIEDDVYGSLLGADHLVRPIATFAPERTFYIGSASKAIAPGLRAGWVVPPMQMQAALSAVVNLRTAASAPFGCPDLTAGAMPFGFLAFAKLCETRLVDEIAQTLRTESGRRLDLARQVLGDPMRTPGDPHSPHVWIELPEGQPEAVHQSLAAGGLQVMTPDAPMVDAAPSGLRLSLGGTEDRASLTAALRQVAREVARARAGGVFWQP